MKPTATAASPAPATSTANARPAKPRLPPREPFGACLASQRELGHGLHPGSRPGTDPALRGMRTGGVEPDAGGGAQPRMGRGRRDLDAEASTAAPDGEPFRPLPACVFSPTGGRPAPPAPATPPPDVTRLANELLRSLHVGGERGRGRVQLVLDGARHGDPLTITLEETPIGVVATLPVGDDPDSQRLVRAIEQELRRRGIELA